MVARMKTKNRQVPQAPGATGKQIPRRVQRLGKRVMAELRDALLAKRLELAASVTALGTEMHNSRAGDEGRSDETERAVVHEEAELNAGLLNAEWWQLREIDDALERIEQGGYGICAATGRPIELKRLRARPWAKYCLEYARQREQDTNRPHLSRSDGAW